MVKKAPAKQAALFEIRLKNDHDVLVLKGPEHDAASALLSGKIVLSLNEPISIKKLAIRLYGTLRLNWTDTINTPKGLYQKPSRFEKKVYEYNWDSGEISKYLNNLYENSAAQQFLSSANVSGNATPVPLLRSHSNASLKNLGHSLRSMSSSNLTHLSSLTGLQSSGLAQSTSGSSTNLHTKASHTLVQGNYEIPFSAVLPGNMPESVEGLPGGSVVYKLEATIDRGKFHNPMITKKHVRIIRTMTTDAVELSETVAVDNTWPKKVEYSLNTPAKAIAIGSGTPISFMLVPLLKGLRLGDIRISLVELYSYVGYVPPPNNDERVVCEKFIPKPSEDDPEFQMDKWEVDTFLKVPPSLSKCTQDCDILTHMKVRHKLKFVIGLVNPDGHVSELRASLPVLLFISPFVTIKARYDETDNSSVKSSSSSVDLQHLHNASDSFEEEYLFTNDPHSASHTSLNQLGATTSDTPPLRSNSNSFGSFTGMMAPPLYEKHIYDRLWMDVSPIDSPTDSGAATPRRPGISDVLQFSMLPLDSFQLNENLRQLSLQRQQESEPPTPRDRPVFNLDGEDTNPGDYLTRGRPILNHMLSFEAAASLPYAMATPGGMQSPPVHLSRVGSENSVFSPSSLSKVPSYSQAMRSDVQDEVLSPAYEPPLPGSRVNLAEANRNYDLSRGSSEIFTHSRSKSRSNTNLRGIGTTSISSSRPSSNGSSPINSRNVSLTNLSSLGKSHSASLSKNVGQVSVTKPSSGASDRSAAIGKQGLSLSLHNLQFMNKKKESERKK